MKLPGSISIMRISGGPLTLPVRIMIKDEVSGVNFCEVNLTLESFANALTSLSQTPCELDLRFDFVGQKAENKEEFVPAVAVPESELIGVPWRDREAIKARYALEPFEVDGWIARDGDYGNHHRGNVEKGYRVVFFRHVPSTEADIEAIRNKRLE